MQSIATVTPIGLSRNSDRNGNEKTAQTHSALRRFQQEALLALGLDDFLAAIDTARADVVTQVDFTGGRFDGERRIGQKIVGTVHTTLGGGFFVLLNGHEKLLVRISRLIRVVSLA